MLFSRFIDQFLVPATSRAVLSWPVISSAIFASVVIQIFGSPDLENTLILFRALAAAASVIPMFLLIAIVQILPLKNRRSRVAAVLLSFVAGGALRGFAVVTFLEGSQILESGNKWFRIPTSAVIMSVEVALATFASANIRRHRERARNFRDESRQLHEVLNQLGRESKASTLRKIQQISTEIVQQLRSIQLNTSKSEISEIQKILNDYIKPLSKSHAPEGLKLTIQDSEIDNASDKQAWKDFNLIGNLPSVWWNAIAALMPFPTASHFFGLKMAVMHSLYIFVVLVPCTWLLQIALRKFEMKLFMPWRELLITAGYFAIALAAALASRVALNDSSNPSFYAVTTLLIYPLFTWAITIGVALQSQIVSQEIKTRKMRDDLAWAVARVNLLDWFNQGLISRLLHGPIQNSLQAASIRLQESPASQNTDKVIEELSQRMNEIAPLTQVETFMAPDISKTLGDLIELWADLARIEVFFEQSVQMQLEQDVPAAYITLDICQEICSNAIRHAKAKTIQINIFATDKALTISMIDDGEPQKVISGFGIGTEFLTTCSINWRSFRDENSKNLLEIEIPTE
jgi:hypothetical protein